VKSAILSVPNRAASLASSVCLAVTAVLAVGYVGLISFEVFARYVFMSSQSWTFELATYLFVFSVFLGSAVGFWDRSHLSVFVPAGSGLPARLHRLCIDLICLAICGVLVHFGYKYAMAGIGRLSPSMGFRMVYIYAALPVSFLLSAVFIVVRWSGDRP
jgi:TRAP-type C4-dicarboxylate transport system permease small subunit